MSLADLVDRVDQLSGEILPVDLALSDRLKPDSGEAKRSDIVSPVDQIPASEAILEAGSPALEQLVPMMPTRLGSDTSLVSAF